MKTCIIGAGIGGLATAAHLAKKHEVEIYERENLLGGRALSCKIENYEKLLRKFEMMVVSATPSMEELPEIASEYKLDLGFHLIGGGKRGACVKLLKELGIELEFIGSKLGLIGEEVSYPILSSSDKLKMLPRIMQLLFTRKSKIEEMKKISMEEMIEKYGRGKLKLVLELFPRLITTVNDLGKISAGETFFAQRELMGGDPVIYPKNGLNEIAVSLAKYIEKNGGKIKLGTEVKEIIIEEGVAKGIKIGKGIKAGEEKEYDVVISTLPVQNIFTIANKKHFPEDWAEYIKNLKPTGSLVAYHALREAKKELDGKSFVFIERNAGFEGNDVVGMIDFKMNAPKGKQLIQSYAICTPEEAKNKAKMEELAKIIEKHLEKLIPSYKMEWCIYSSIWHLDGVAKTIDNEKPGVTTPIKNLYIAGDCVNSKGVGMNCAADSARLIVNNLKI